MFERGFELAIEGDGLSLLSRIAGLQQRSPAIVLIDALTSYIGDGCPIKSLEGEADSGSTVSIRLPAEMGPASQERLLWFLNAMDGSVP